jgi:membrane-associated protein
MGELVEAVLAVRGWPALALLFLLPALEAPAFLGLVLPGELALVLGGVLAFEGRVALGTALALGVAGALLGDSAGYWIGRRWGDRLLDSTVGRLVKPARLERAKSLLRRRSGPALFFGRLTAGARVLLPGLAGASKVRYRAFVAWNAAAGAIWAVAHVLLGYAAGEGWRRVHAQAGRAGLLLLAGLAVVLLAALAVRALRSRHRPGASAGRPAGQPDAWRHSSHPPGAAGAGGCLPPGTVDAEGASRRARSAAGVGGCLPPGR